MARETSKQRNLPRKRFGQNFLTDSNILRKIVSAGEISPGDTVLEIGPGRGSLTKILAETGARVAAVEVDLNLVSILEKEFKASSNVHILQGDILKEPAIKWLEKASLTPPYIVVANIPYYITSAILRYLLESSPPPTRIVVLVQKEVARQIIAKAPKGNLLGTSIQYYGTPRIITQVPAGAFFPRPKVDSAVIRIDVEKAITTNDTASFFRVSRFWGKTQAAPERSLERATPVCR
jgi:16S rRNA (adenine1518-N6/adenine1519-N6)-dimethyltransferase